MNLRLAVCAVFASQSLAGIALAQPALDRVTEQLRKQVAPRTAALADGGAGNNPAPAEEEPAGDTPGYLGLLGDDRQENGQGVRVTKTEADAPAAKGGLKIGDLITAIDGQPIKSMEEMGEILSTKHAGSMVKFSIERNGDTRDLQIRLERRPPPGYLGILGDDRQENGKGVRVTKTDPGGPATKGGLKAGDLITAVDDQPIKTMDEMGDIMMRRYAGAMVKFTVERDGATRDVQVRLEKRPAPRLAPQFGKQPEDMPAPGNTAGAAPGPAPGSSDPGDSLILGTRRPKLGVKTVGLTPFIREQTRLPGSYVAGVYVTYVDPDAPAGKGGLPTNAIITSVDGEPIDSPDTLAALVHRAGPGQVLNVTYYYHDHESQATITLAGGPPRPPAPGPQATVRARPLPSAQTVPEQPPGFMPDEADAADTPPPADKTAALERRIAELEKRVAELEAAAAAPPQEK